MCDLRAQSVLSRDGCWSLQPSSLLFTGKVDSEVARVDDMKGHGTETEMGDDGQR